MFFELNIVSDTVVNSFVTLAPADWRKRPLKNCIFFSFSRKSENLIYIFSRANGSLNSQYKDSQNNDSQHDYKNTIHGMKKAQYDDSQHNNKE